MTTKQMKFDLDAQQEFRRGVEQISRAVALTMGPTGRNVVVQKSFGGPAVTKDGVSVAKEVELEQPFENMGAKMINEVAKKTSDVAGDGTTCATVLARSIFTEGLRHVTAGAAPTYPAGDYNGTTGHFDNLTNFAEGKLEDASP